MGTADGVCQRRAGLRNTLPANFPGPLVEPPIDVGCFDENKLSCHESIILLGCDKNSGGTMCNTAPAPRMPVPAKVLAHGPRQRPRQGADPSISRAVGSPYE